MKPSIFDWQPEDPVGDDTRVFARFLTQKGKDYKQVGTPVAMWFVVAHILRYLMRKYEMFLPFLSHKAQVCDE